MAELSIFAPLVNTEYCLWFYYLSVVGFTLALLSIFSLIVLTLKKKMNINLFFQMIWITLIYMFLYFQNRILYSMCKNSMNK